MNNSNYVKNKTFYHIHKPNGYSPLWVPGNQIDFTIKRLNEFSSYYSKAKFILNFRGENHYPNSLVQKINQSGVPDGHEIVPVLDFFGTVIKESALYLREIVFEEVRLQYFSNLPSRKNCIWVFEKDATDYWSRTLGGSQHLLRLELTGVIHIADQRHLVPEILPEDIIRQNAFNYWTGTDGQNKCEQEILFEGIVKILDEVNLP